MMPKTSAVLRSIREWVPRAVAVWAHTITELSLSILCTWIPTTRYKIRFLALRRKVEMRYTAKHEAAVIQAVQKLDRKVGGLQVQ
jgi:hypothetical protein